ncbi:MAG TPA: two-component regulator propeller domain-containing protein [Verrucomicrobiae bacterium]|nr:two-component regulator propeller domain-containing protein [Verrucomicrobiae bacterium]
MRAAAALCLLANVSLAAPEQLPADDVAAREGANGPGYVEGDYLIDFWRVEQGLPHDTVIALLQTSDGYLWVGTAGGLVRFDGLTFTPIGDEVAPGLKDARITALLQDRDGAVWIGTQGGGVFRLQRGQAVRYTSDNGLVDNAVTSLAEDAGGTIWIGTQRGLNRWQDGRLSTFSSDVLRAGESVVALHAGRRGVLWITTRSEVFRLHDGKVEPFRLENIPQEGNAELRGAYEDRAGNLWTFSATFLLNLSQGKRYNAFRSLDPASSRVWPICEQDNGTFWIGTSGRGLARFYKGRFEAVGAREGLDQCDVRALLADQQGNIWIGTSDNGLARLRTRQWRMFNGSDGLASTRLTALAVEPGGHLWIGTEDAGLMRFNGTHFESFTAGTPLNSAMHVQSLSVDARGALWVGTWGRGLFRVADGRLWHYGTAEGLSDDIVTAVVAEHRDEAVWVGTGSGGLHRITETNMVSFAVTDGLTGQPVRCLLVMGDNQLMVGTDGGGLVRWDGTQLGVVPTPAQLASHPVHALAQDRAGRLWVGTVGAGVFCRNGMTWLHLAGDEGLISDVIEQIVVDDAGNLWFGSDQGIFQVRAAAVEAFVAGRARSVNCILCAHGGGAGVVKCPTAFPGAVRTASGALWFASNEGLFAVDDPAMVKAAAVPRVMIEKVLVDGQPMPWSAWGDKDAVLTLGPGVRSLDLAFTAINFNAPEKTRFRYKLEGSEPAWTQSGQDRHAHYGPLPPGRYRFRVIASNADGVWNEEGASLAVQVLPSIWRAWWFLTLCGLAVVLLIAAVVRFVSLRRLHAQLRESEQRRAMERERTRIAQDMHDEIGSKLTRISFLSEIARQNATEAREPNIQVEAIADTSRELLQALDEIVWAVNPRNDSLEHLAGYLEQYAREYFQMTTVECAISVPPFLPEVELSAEFRHNVFLAFEEALGNALKHANATRVAVTMQMADAAFEICVTDDGRGFDPQHAGRTGRDGLRNMQARLLAIGGQCETTSAPGKGTTVRLRCPLPQATAVKA